MATSDFDSSDADPSLIALLKVITYKKWILLVRYPVNTASEFLTLFIFFLLIFFGGQAIAGPALTDSLDGIIVGFFLFSLAITSYSGLAWSVTREAQWGTLERLYMSPHGLGTVMGVMTVVNVCFSFLWGLLLLILMMATTGRWLTFDPFSVVPLVFLTLMSVIGLGYLFGGLALIYKRIENVFQLLQFGFIGLIAAPVNEIRWLMLLPVAHGSYFTRVVMEDAVRIWDLPAAELAILVITSTTYLLIGYYCFYRAGRIARMRGVMGHY
ncbi:hypothetical protein [Haloarcula argentinensis]|uniref:ABC transporter permease n=1 Tax=Haloarcula argentinensis TaxID=43776 RepID=A0A830FHV3_HALAR|nr:hypothetical protein [Haloarcula argentinensis]EMA26830.1 hypothetical protein C443_00657 [Haloarcula argentinensis DSM 12282]MDS0255780.1 ABC transporter permease [Haloarcula argentinensis]GGM51612.1 hypothetical protein GCM10009006_36010 [Haloarcula argentinensis]